MNLLVKNPYRPFFLIGTAGLMSGLAVWIFYGLYSQTHYPGKMHAHYMIGIFLLSFVIGFLMTTIPSMTRAPGSSYKEFIFQLVPMLIASVLGLFDTLEIYFFLSLGVSLVVLLRFCASRIISAPHMIPDVFPMVIISILSGLAGILFFIFGQYEIGGKLFYLNMILGLCVGVGAKLIPMILRLGCSHQYKTNEMWFIGSALTASCFIEVYGKESYGSFLRFIILILVFFRYWHGSRPSGFNSSVAIGVRVAALSIVLGTFGLWFFSDYRLEALHLLYISGFGLLTIMIASRIILAHGNYDLSLEFQNWFLKIPIGLILLAAIVRISAVFIEGSFERHLAYASLSFLLGGVLWAFYFLPKIKLKQSNSNCLS